MPRTLLVILLVPFGLLSAEAIWVHGYLGIWRGSMASLATLQVLADLVIACTLIMVWMWHDAKKHGRIVWPWLIATLTLGSFGPLAYLLTQKPATPG